MEPDEREALTLAIYEELASPLRPFKMKKEDILELVKNHGMDAIAKWYLEWIKAEERRREFQFSRQFKQKKAMSKPYAQGLEALLTACSLPSNEQEKIAIGTAFIKVVRDGGPEALRDMADIFELLERDISLETRPGEMLAIFKRYLMNGLLISQASLLKEYSETNAGRGDERHNALALLKEVGLAGLPKDTAPEMEKVTLRLQMAFWEKDKEDEK